MLHYFLLNSFSNFHRVVFIENKICCQVFTVRKYLHYPMTASDCCQTHYLPTMIKAMTLAAHHLQQTSLLSASPQTTADLPLATLYDTLWEGHWPHPPRHPHRIVAWTVATTWGVSICDRNRQIDLVSKQTIRHNIIQAWPKDRAPEWNLNYYLWSVPEAFNLPHLEVVRLENAVFLAAWNTRSPGQTN